MGRPPLPIGTYGKITVIPLPDGGHRARCKFRDYDGTTRLVERSGTSKSKAENALKEAIRDRQGPTAGTITGDTKLAALGADWYAEIEKSDKAIGTKQTYEHALNKWVLPAVGALRVREATVGPLDKALRSITDNHGPGAARSSKTVLSLMLQLAARHDAIAINPVRDTSKISGSKPERARSLTREQEEEIVDAVRTMQRAIDLDLPDLIEWMLGTGARIGESSAVRRATNSEGEPVLDLETGTWEVNATIVRRTGAGLWVQPRTKSDAGWRVLALPDHLLAMVDRRDGELRLAAPDGVIFGSPGAKALRDPSNTPDDLRQVIDAIGCTTCNGTALVPALNGRTKKCPDAGPYAWVHSHTFRKTVATRMEEAGCSPREIADQLGHAKPSMTLDHYMGRSVVSAKAAKILAR